MLTYKKLKKNRREFLALTGLTAKEFKQLLPAFTQAYERQYPSTKTHAGKKRKRKSGGGRKGNLQGAEQKLLFVLVYQKTYPVQAVLGALFDLSQSRANEWLHLLLPILQQALDDLGVLPERQPRQFARHEKRQSGTKEFIIDGTERRRQRPKSQKNKHYTIAAKRKLIVIKTL